MVVTEKKEKVLSCNSFDRKFFPEMCKAMGQMPLINKIRGVEYATVEIQNSMFLPKLKKALIGGRRQNYFNFSYNK